MKPGRESSDWSRSAQVSNQQGTLTVAATIGIVGTGLMGSSIASCLLAAGHTVAAVEADAARLKKAPRRILAFLKGLRTERLLKSDPNQLLRKLSIASDYSRLRGSAIVIESVVENLEIKRRVIRKIEEVVPADTLVGSNTSAIPPTLLQRDALHPERILGIHWGEPAHVTPFMEIICGEKTRPVFAERALRFARQLGKEPSLLRKDVRGFITNRVMYAMLREAFHLVESGVASIADVDRSLRNDLGYWITFAGPFRFMDLTGIPAYAAVMRELLPELDCSQKLPRLMRKVVKSGARGVSNAKGFYDYTPSQARRWEEFFLRFSYDIRALAYKYRGKVEYSPRRDRNGAA
jgi:3-hydroxybutyryl-CoA dehydrogenase